MEPSTKEHIAKLEVACQSWRNVAMKWRGRIEELERDSEQAEAMVLELLYPTPESDEKWRTIKFRVAMEEINQRFSGIADALLQHDLNDFIKRLELPNGEQSDL